MFDKLKDLGGLMQQAQQMQQKMKDLQDQLERLEIVGSSGAGLVKVTVDPDDKRGRLLALTPAGKKLLARAMPIWTRTHAEIEARLTDGGAELLCGNLRALA